MKTDEKSNITVEAKINAPIDRVWQLWTDPKHIVHWNNASDDWYTPNAKNNLKPGGKFLIRMEARDGSYGFDFSGSYDTVEKNKQIGYTMDDGRKVNIIFKSEQNWTKVTEVFEAEKTNPVEVQHDGWQSILNNFKTYSENAGRFELLKFETRINAPARKVYRTMIDEQKYKEWTSVFEPTSHFIGNWEKGSKMLFLGTGKDGKIGGMSSKIRENIPDKFIRIEHLGMIEDGKEVQTGPDGSNWAGALESYSLTEKNGSTLLTVETDTDRKNMSYFQEHWPIALRKLKELCER